VKWLWNDDKLWQRDEDMIVWHPSISGPKTPRSNPIHYQATPVASSPLAACGIALCRVSTMQTKAHRPVLGGGAIFEEEVRAQHR